MRETIYHKGHKRGHKDHKRTKRGKRVSFFFRAFGPFVIFVSPFVTFVVNSQY